VPLAHWSADAPCFKTEYLSYLQGFTAIFQKNLDSVSGNPYVVTLMLEAADYSEISVCMCVTSHSRREFSLDNTCLWYATFYIS